MSYSVVPDTPLADTLVAMTSASLQLCDLEDREIMLTRLAALAALGAPPASYALNAEVAAEIGLTLEDVQGLLIAVAPVVGTARTVAAATNIAIGLGIAIARAEETADGDE